MSQSGNDLPAEQTVDGTTGEALTATAELKRRRFESSRRLEKLDEERQVLEEIRASIAYEEKAIFKNLASAQEDHDRLTSKSDRMTRRSMEMNVEIEELKREITILEHRFSIFDEKKHNFISEIETVEKSLLKNRKEISNASNELEIGRAMLARIDQKLSLGKLKRKTKKTK